MRSQSSQSRQGNSAKSGGSRSQSEEDDESDNVFGFMESSISKLGKKANPTDYKPVVGNLLAKMDKKLRVLDQDMEQKENIDKSNSIGVIKKSTRNRR